MVCNISFEMYILQHVKVPDSPGSRKNINTEQEFLLLMKQSTVNTSLDAEPPSCSKSLPQLFIHSTLI